MRMARIPGILALLCLVSFAHAQAPAPQQVRTPDVIYVPTPPEVVAEMLKVANVTKNDVVYDLGSGDGRIVITAAKERGARGVGIDIDPERIREANENARAAGVTDKVKFLQQDLFETDFREATVVTLYLLPSLNVKLRPKLFKDLRPGTRIVSHSFDMGDWKPDQTIDVDGRTVYYWVIPANASKK
jgi:SAM-dependent methyltransferase